MKAAIVIIDDLQAPQVRQDASESKEVIPCLLAEGAFNGIKKFFRGLAEIGSIVLEVIDIEMGSIGNQIADRVLQVISKSPKHGEIRAAL